MRKLFQGFFSVLRRRRALLSAAVLLLAALCALRASRISLGESVLDMLPAGEKVIEDFHTIVSRFGYQNRLFFDVGDGGEEENCAAADELYEQLAASGFFGAIRYRVRQEEGLAAMALLQEHMPALFGAERPEKLLPLLEKDKVSGQLARYRKMLFEMPMTGPLAGMVRGDPLGLQSDLLSGLAGFYDGAEIKDGRICSLDGEHLMLVAVPGDGRTHGLGGAEMIAFVEKARGAAEAAHPGVKIRYTGAPRMSVENQRMMMHDIKFTMLVSTLVILALTFLVYRRPSLVLLGLLPLVFGGLLAAGSFALFADKMSAIVAGFGGALIGIAVDYAVHMSYRYDNFNAFSSGPAGLAGHLSSIAAPLVMSAATTVAAFLCLLLSPMPGQRQLGVFGAVGIGGAALFSLLALPQMFSLRPPRRKKPILSLARLWTAFFEWHRRHTWLCAALILAVSLFCALGLPRLAFDGDIRRLSGMSPGTAQDERAISGRWGGKFFKNTLVAVRGASPGEARGKNDSLYCLLLELERSGLVKKFTSISPLAPSAAAQRDNVKRWRSFWGGGRAELVKKRLAEAGREQGFSASAFEPFYGKLGRREDSFPPEKMESGAFGDAVGSFLSRGTEETLVLTEVETPGYDAFVGEVRARIPDALFYNGDAFALRVSGLARKGLLLFAWAALAASFLVLLLSYGRPELVLVVMAVLGLDALCSLGLLGWLGLRVNLMNNILILFIFGMCVDYAVYMVSSCLAVYAGWEEDPGVTGGAMAISALTTIGCFLALCLAWHPALRSIGITAVIVILVGLAAAALLPPLAMRILLWQNGRNGTPTLRTLACGLAAFGFFGLALVYCRAVFMPWLRLRHNREPAARRKALQSFLRTSCRLLLRFVPYGKRIFLNAGPGAFTKPAVIVCNHQSVLDIICSLALPADIRMVVKPWVWNSFFMGPVIREAGYILSDGKNTAELFERAAQCLREGDFLLFFPEGTRSESGQLSRFRKGAFEIAARSGAEILPVVMCETRSCIPKTGFWAGDHRFVVSVLPRLTVTDPDGTPRCVRKLMEDEYERALAIACDGPEFFRRIRARYNYLGPYVEQYAAWKLRLDPLFGRIAGLVPREGVVLDLGHGYGLMSNILAAQSTRRTVIGIDFDEEKVAVARKSAVAPGRMTSELGDLLACAFPSADTALLIDVLHYWPEAGQEKILRKAYDCLKPGGRLIMRENCAEPGMKSGAVRLAEKFAVFIGHNKSSHGIIPGNRENYLRLLAEIGFNCSQAVDDLGWRSNLVFICEKPA
ncbi:MAG: hypothetical protein COT18_12030 [Elusimicrobia bacterium CG08_land_8_20_14_0_20_59_10]|nr:MAG: hypothetical protein COT18_12030 [Elusimicrobia bacterium CG08_land_8_20_14_0_20_59_10]